MKNQDCPTHHCSAPWRDRIHECTESRLQEVNNYASGYSLNLFSRLEERQVRNFDRESKVKRESLRLCVVCPVDFAAGEDKCRATVEGSMKLDEAQLPACENYVRRVRVGVFDGKAAWRQARQASRDALRVRRVKREEADRNVARDRDVAEIEHELRLRRRAPHKPEGFCVIV